MLAVDLFPNLLPGRRGFLIDLTYWSDQWGMEKSLSAGWLCPADARALAGHLLNAAELADERETESGAGLTGVRMLPTITLCGRTFFIDEQLRLSWFSVIWKIAPFELAGPG